MTSTDMAGTRDPETRRIPPPRSDGLLDEVVATREELRERARVTLGVTGDGRTEKLRRLLKEHRMGVYPLVALGILTVTDEFQGYAFTVFTPDIARSMGIGFGAMAGVAAIKGLAIAVAPLPMAWLSQHRARRAMLCLVTAMGWALLTTYTGLVTSLTGLILILVADGLSTGSSNALHSPLLMDSYHPDARVRVVSSYTAINRFGEVLSPLLVALLAGPFDLTWRGVFIGLGLFATVSTLGALGLRDPGYGKWDTQRIRRSVHDRHGDEGDLDEEDVALGFWEICRRLMLIPTVRRLLAGLAVIGVLTAPLGVFLSFFLEARWELEADQRALFLAYQAGVSVIALVIYGSRGERLFRENPARILTTTGVALAVAIAAIAVGGLVPNFTAMLVAFGVSAAALGIIGPALIIGIMSIVPAAMRPHAGGLFGIFTAIGTVAGALLLGSVQDEYGSVGSIVTFLLIGTIGSMVIASAGRFINADLDRMIDEILEDEEIKQLADSGARLPMLTCRNIDFSYGQLQVLFDVDFTVDHGEMVALLGVNGAGKSTLLRVISGVGLPSRGSVRFRGQDVTFLDAERRVNLGITQIPGGKAVFGPMTVIENLRSFGYTAPGGRRRLDARIDECLEAFPRLAERRNSLAAQLSGGEQQMLALSKALILSPRLLVIDELSLGLAPVVVAQLLEMVKKINATGTAVVLVEQSVNIALNLVEHAYFMEKGEMKFDGRAADLLERDDLLRAVFLSGSSAMDGTT
jgi:ABC-type branched-subunit amino acid transport system ATPase component/sugar phosphate permease